MALAIGIRISRARLPDEQAPSTPAANDGALHAFDADTGTELLAYFPGHLASTASATGYHYLSDPDYGHHYYVDGSPVVGDAFVKASTAGSAAWRSVLIGSDRAGGRGLFALDVTDPRQFPRHLYQGGTSSAVGIQRRRRCQPRLYLQRANHCSFEQRPSGRLSSATAMATVATVRQSCLSSTWKVVWMAPGPTAVIICVSAQAQAPR